MKIKETIKREVQEVQEVADGLKETILSIALVITAGYNWYELTLRPVDQVEFYVRVSASAIIAYVGARQLLTIFKNLGGKQ